MRNYCLHCNSAVDWIDLITTKCPDCPDAPPPEKTNLVHRSSVQGQIAQMRARELKAQLRFDLAAGHKPEDKPAA